MTTDTNKQELLPCPFCGRVGLTFHEGSTFRWIEARCNGCGASAGEVRVQTTGRGTPEEWRAEAESEAVREWNQRAAPQGEAVAWRDWVEQRLHSWQLFEEWLCREMPAGTIIGDPKWWAPRIAKAAALLAAAPAVREPSSDYLQQKRDQLRDEYATGLDHPPE